MAGAMSRNIAVVTGASRGIGQETAVLFHARGWTVINLSRNPSPIDGVASITCDMADADSIAAACATVGPQMAEASRVALVHNAAITRNDSVHDLTPADFLHMLQVNVVAPQILNRLLLPKMKAGSALIYVGSTLSEIGAPNSFSYTATKHALAGMMKASVQDLKGSGIHGCLICPGFTETQMLLEDVFGNDPARVEQAKAMVLMGRLVDPKEIAEVIHFCAENPVMNGAVLHANLGQG